MNSPEQIAEKALSKVAPAQSETTQLLQSEYMQAASLAAREIESTPINNARLNQELAITMEEIYTSKGGGAAGQAQEMAFMKSINDKLGEDHSNVQLEMIPPTAGTTNGQPDFELVSNVPGQAQEQSAPIIPSKGGAQDLPLNTTGQPNTQPTEAPPQPHSKM